MSHLPQGGWQKRYVNMGDLDLHLYPLEGATSVYNVMTHLV